MLQTTWRINSSKIGSISQRNWLAITPDKLLENLDCLLLLIYCCKWMRISLKCVINWITFRIRYLLAPKQELTNWNPGICSESRALTARVTVFPWRKTRFAKLFDCLMNIRCITRLWMLQKMCAEGHRRATWKLFDRLLF